MINYFKEIRYILDKEAKKVPLLLLLFLFASIIDLLGIGLIAPYVGLIVDPAGFNESYIYNLAIEMGVPFQYYDPITLIGVILVIIFGAKTILAIFINKAILSFSYKQSVILRSLLMGSYQQLPYTDFIDNNSSKYIYNIQQMAGSFSQGILQSILRLASEAIVAIVLLLFLAITNFSALIMLVIMLGSTMFIFDWLFKAKMERYGRLANEHLTCMIKGIQEGMNGLKEIRILKKEKYFYDAVHDSAKDYAKVSVKNQVIYVAPRYIIEFVLILFVVTLVLVAQLMNQNLTELLPVLSMFGLAAIRLMPSTNQIINGVNQVRIGRHTINELYNDIKNIRNRHQVTSSSTNPIKIEPFQSITLNKISFSYPRVKYRTINKISLQIFSGNTIGLIGASGSGKTTLVDILLGLLEVQSGEVLYNNKKLLKNDLSFYSQVAYLPQQVFLIDSTLRKNIAIGVIESEIDEDKLNKAIEQALLTELVNKMPKGVNTELGEEGVKLSGGQKQRVALARAFYNGRNILVMDESTSALDNQTEKEIVDVIDALHGKKTLIVIAHRMTTLKHVDIIYKLDNGRIVQKGTYSDIVDAETGLEKKGGEA
ncbi:MAG: ABC transporter ATP-binding protein [Gammaproteobacteria bacterium]|nr:ABC transporter ATP-binding protein [Gammaproteobacteria bacterium]